MTVCANRVDEPGFFTGCNIALGRACACGKEVEAEEADETRGNE